ncbi:MAG: hypothetical protein ACTSRP_13455 [Candidatus Helarchaeota archaeon]
MDNRNGKIKKKTLSKWQVLMKFPNSLFMVEQSLKSKEIQGQKVDIERYLDQAKKIYKRIIVGERIRENFNRQRFSLLKQSSNQAQSENLSKVEDFFVFENLDNNGLDNFFKDNIEQLIINELEDENKHNFDNIKRPKIIINNFFELSSEFNKIEICQEDIKDQIRLIEIQDDTYLEAKVFPKSYHCWKCGHYLVLNSNYHGNFKCSCCNNGILEQEALIFICPICADVLPIYPWWERHPQEIQNKVFQCPDDGCEGHIHLFINTENLMKSSWNCNVCNTNFFNNSSKFAKTKERRLIQYCKKCGVYSKFKENSLKIQMKLKPTTARLFIPFIYESITVNNESLNKQNLEENLKQLHNNNDPLYWNLEEKIHILNLIKNKFAIKNIYFIKNIKTFNAVFGYQSALQNNLNIEPIPNFFKSGRIYNIYFFEHIGNGLVIELDLERIEYNLSKLLDIKKKINYRQIIDHLIHRIENDRIQVILNDNESIEFKLLKALHTFNHILLQNVFKRIGLEYFRSKILLKDGLILLYEIDDISTGGLYQLTLETDPIIEILELFFECEISIKNCIHDCDDYCKQCSFIDDYYCRPFINEEITRWIPSNAFLSRKLAKDLLLKV